MIISYKPIILVKGRNGMECTPILGNTSLRHEEITMTGYGRGIILHGFKTPPGNHGSV